MLEKAIKVSKISKTFVINKEKSKGALSIFVNFLNGQKNTKSLKVLDSISFEVNKGDVLGIIGKNGCGKSTLLKIIAGILCADYGSVFTLGNVVYLSGFGYGLVQKLTMRENIFLIGTLMGLSKKEILNKIDKIVEFSGLKEFIDNKVYKFSSGMIVRLNFSITIHCLEYKKPDIILLDEVLDVGGDIDFQNKAIQKIENLIKSGSAIIIVSHNLETIKKYCQKVVWLNENVIKIGGAEKIITEYENSIKK